MSERNHALRRILTFPWAYEAFDLLIANRRGRRLFVRDHLRPRSGERLLDIGCGPGSLLPYLPGDLDYVGLEPSAAYVERARDRFRDRGRFVCGGVTTPGLDLGQGFDCVVASGVMHHLDDGEVEALLRLAHAALRPGGRLVTLDGCRVPNQSVAVRWLLDNDRGRHVRTQQAYAELVGRVFTGATAVLRDDLLRIPYLHIIFTTQR